MYSIVGGIAHDTIKKVPQMPSISWVDLLAYDSRCPLAHVGPPCATTFPAPLVDSMTSTAYKMWSNNNAMFSYIAMILIIYC